MAILYGTTGDGTTLPVLVDQFGNLLAKGIDGQPGTPGPPGPPGADGGSFPLPPDPYEGALLGWEDGELAWIGTPPIPIPPGVFGPITAYDPGGFITVESTLPLYAENGVYIYQCDVEGNYSNPAADFLSTYIWSDYCSGQTYSGVDAGWRSAFDGDLNTRCSPADKGEVLFTSPALIPCTKSLRFYQGISYCNQEAWIQVNAGNFYYGGGVNFPNQRNQWVSLPVPETGELSSLKWRRTSGSNSIDVCAVEVDGEILVDTNVGIPQGRINSRLNDNSLTIVPSNTQLFSVGEYLWIPEQRVAPWVLYKNDPTLLIDHVRSSRD